MIEELPILRVVILIKAYERREWCFKESRYIKIELPKGRAWKLDKKKQEI